MPHARGELGGVSSIRDLQIESAHGGVPIRVYTPQTPLGPGLVWVHGGSFCGGDLDMPESDWVATALAARGIAVVAVDYRRAPLPPTPGVHYPVASNEIESVFRWARTAGLATGPWSLGGASAGGNLAVGATLRLSHAGGPSPALALLAYPTLHAKQAAPGADLRRALDDHPDADNFGPGAVRAMYENYLGGRVDDADIYAVPGNAQPSELASFPPTIMVNDEIDELRVSGEEFAASLRLAGVTVDLHTRRGTRHGHLNRPDEPGAVETVEDFAAYLLRHSTERGGPIDPAEPARHPL